MKKFKNWFNGLNGNLQMILSFIFVPLAITLALIVLFFGAVIVSVIFDGFNANGGSEEVVTQPDDEPEAQSNDKENEDREDQTNKEKSENTETQNDNEKDENQENQTNHEESKETESSNNDEEVSKKVTKEYSIMGLDIKINDIIIDGKYLDIDITTVNTSDQTLTHYFDQGDIIIKNKQETSNFLMNKGDLGGEIHPGVEKEGLLRYVLPDDTFDDAEEITLRFGNITDENYTSEEFTDTIKLK